jgi:hypothetical protein
MKKKALIYCGILACLVSGCVSAPVQSDLGQRTWAATGDFWQRVPSSGGMVFHGIAPIRSKRDESIQLALEDAARKVAIYFEVEGSLKVTEARDGSISDYLLETETTLNHDEDYTKYINSLEYDPELDVFEYDRDIVVRVQYRGAGPGISYSSTGHLNVNSRPTWINTPPVFPGYRVVSGYAGRRRLLRDTMNASYDNAIFSVIREVSSVVRGSTENVQGAGIFGSSLITKSQQESHGVIHGFYVIDSWIDPTTYAVWTLAIAQKE